MASADFLKVGHFTPFSEFVHIEGRNSPEICFRLSLRITPIKHEKFHGNGSARFSEIRNTDTQTDRCGNCIYIDVLASSICALRVADRHIRQHGMHESKRKT